MANLGYQDFTPSSKKEQLKIDQRVKESRKEFTRGSGAGLSFALTVYSIWSIVKSSPAYAADSKKLIQAPILISRRLLEQLE